MIIQVKPESDSYITNIKTENNDGLYANVGKAATIDLFKLYNENKNSFSWIPLKINQQIQQDEKLVLTDSLGNVINFIFKVDVETKDGSLDNENNVIIGLLNNNNENQSNIISQVINNVSNFNNSLTLEITALSNSSNVLLLKQNQPGNKGDTNIVLPQSGSISHLYNDQINFFSRIDYSFGLIKFNFLEIKNKWNIDNVLPGAFQTLKARIMFKDITSGLSKPKKYSLEVKELQKKFIEGNGKDTIHFSDKDVSNFVKLNEEENWEMPGFISESEALDITAAEFSVQDGDEDISIDITDYVKSALIDDPDNDCGLILKFKDYFLYDEKSYFVKRLGSRHLLNKSLIPLLEIKIDDATYNFTTHNFTKQRNFNVNEKFYIFNKNSGRFSDFSSPGVNYELKLRVKSENNNTVFLNDVDSNSNVTNYLGTTILGIKKAELSLDKFNDIISNSIEENKLTTNIEWYWLDQVTKVVTAGNFIIGKRYKIKTHTDTPFTDIGAADNEINTVFTATGAGSGSNDAFELIEKTLLTRKVIFKTLEATEDVSFLNLTAITKSINSPNNKILANDDVHSFNVLFVDTKKDYAPSKKSYEITSEDLGDVYYQICDSNTKEVIVDYEEENKGTLLFYDGEKYKANIFISSHLKGKNIHLNFKHKSSFNENNLFIRSSSNIILEK